MAKAQLIVKTDPKIKERAARTAKQLGIPLGTVINAFLRQFIQDKTVTFAIEQPPTAALLRVLKQAEEDVRAERDLSPAFTDAKEAISFLRA